MQNPRNLLQNFIINQCSHPLSLTIHIQKDTNFLVYKDPDAYKYQLLIILVNKDFYDTSIQVIIDFPLLFASESRRSAFLFSYEYTNHQIIIYF